MLEAAGVELDRLSEYGLILKNARKSEAAESLESLEILVRAVCRIRSTMYLR